MNNLITRVSDMDRVFDQLWGSNCRPATSSALRTLSPRVDIEETDGEFRVRMDLPGVKREDLKVEIEDPSGEHRGLWVGRVRVPGDQPEPTPVLPTPTPSPIPTPPPLPTPTVAVPTPVPEAENVAEPEAAAATVAAASVANATAPPQNDPSARTRSAARAGRSSRPASTATKTAS